MVCPKCGNTWIIDNFVTEQLHRKHWYSTPQWTPFHELYPNEPRYLCPECGTKWGTFSTIRKGIVSGVNVQEIRESIDYEEMIRKRVNERSVGLQQKVMRP